VTRQSGGLVHSGQEDQSVDWSEPLIWYIQSPGDAVYRKIHCQAIKYTVYRKIHCQAIRYTMMDDKFYRRTNEGLLLKCLDEEAARVAMGELHELLCGTHQSAEKMRWVLKRSGVYWPMMIEDCVRYRKGCEACQKFGEIQSVPTSELCPIIKPWLFRGWSLDFIGEIHPSLSKGHRFVLVTTNYITKWTEAVSLRNMTHKELIDFVQGHIVHRFRILQTLMTDQGSSFMSHQFKEFAEPLKIKLMNSLPYYAEANGQAELAIGH
jgi:hypothetical protein